MRIKGVAFVGLLATLGGACSSSSGGNGADAGTAGTPDCAKQDVCTIMLSNLGGSSVCSTLGYNNFVTASRGGPGQTDPLPGDCEFFCGIANGGDSPIEITSACPVAGGLNDFLSGEALKQGQNQATVSGIGDAAYTFSDDTGGNYIRVYKNGTYFEFFSSSPTPNLTSLARSVASQF